jgi:3-oxoacyl-[acyl-carrier protein] reductase
MAKLQGKTAVVTGASKGIGAAIAQELANDGAAVVINYANSPQQAEALAAKIRAAGGRAKAVRADVSKPAEARQLIKAAVSEFGQLDIWSTMQVFTNSTRWLRFPRNTSTASSI